MKPLPTRDCASMLATNVRTMRRRYSREDRTPEIVQTTIDAQLARIRELRSMQSARIRQLRVGPDPRGGGCDRDSEHGEAPIA